MIKRIEGTDATKKMIKAIVQNARKDRPNTKYVDYTINLEKKFEHSDLSTFEYQGVVRNVSNLNINPLSFPSGIKAAIGNVSGAIDIESIPFYMSTKKAQKKIMNFLTQLQPENRTNSKMIKTSPLVSDAFTIEEDFGKYKIESEFEGSNTTPARKQIFEILKRYRTL